MGAEPFVPPPYPYDRLDDLKAVGESLPGGLVDLSIGTPCDPPPPAVVEALARSGAERGYPPSIGSRRLSRGGRRVDGPTARRRRSTPPTWRRASAPRSSWPACRSGSACDDPISTPCSTRRSATRPTRWGPPWPAAGRCLTATSTTIDPADADRALCLWVNVPATPPASSSTSGRRPRGAASAACRSCPTSATWSSPGSGPPRTILEHGADGVLAVHSLSKRSNLAGTRAGFYAGDPELVRYLSEVRKHAGFMVPGPVQAAAVAAWNDDVHVEEQRERYRRRLDATATALAKAGVEARRSPTVRSTCGPRRPTATPGGWPGGSPRPAARWCRPASSTDPRAPASFGWRSCSPTIASPSSPSGSRARCTSGPCHSAVRVEDR